MSQLQAAGAAPCPPTGAGPPVRRATAWPTPLRRAALGLWLALGLGLGASAARADCIDDAAAAHGVNAWVLRAIGWQESRLQPAARHDNRNGSHDLGAFQINSVHHAALARHGISSEALRDGCTNARVAAWLYGGAVRRLGDGWAAVGAYHSPTPALASAYARGIHRVLAAWQVPPSALPPAFASGPPPATAPGAP